MYVNNGQAQPGCSDHIEDLIRKPDQLVTLTDLNGWSVTFVSLLFISLIIIFIRMIQDQSTLTFAATCARSTTLLSQSILCALFRHFLVLRGIVI